MSLQGTSSPSSVHEHNLSLLCRVCGFLITDDWYPVKDFTGDLMKTFKVDVSKYVNNVHPPRFCLEFYALVTNCVKRGSVCGGGGGDCSNVISSFKVIASLFIYVFYLILTLIHIFSNFTRAIG